MMAHTFLVVLLAATTASAQIPAFPGAEGFGAQTPGGRRGKAIFVVNLNDSGPGSFRAACEAKGPRIVVFRAAGLIDLKSPVRVTEPFLTIAGQSAPGDGVCLRGAALAIDTHDVIVRHLRVRPGDISGREEDGIAIGGSSRNVIIDHCSVSWAIDENLSPSGGVADITVQWSLIAEGLNRSVHAKGAHGYGSLVRAVGGLTMHHNLWAHNPGRNPRLGDNYGRPPFPTFDVRNNVIYNAGGPSVAGDTFSANYVGNYHRPGPNSNLSRGLFAPTPKADLRFYVEDTVVEGKPEWSTNPAQLFARLVTLVAQPFATPAVRTIPASEAYSVVLDRAGATVPVRDPVDQRIAGEVRSGGGAHIDSQWEVGGWPEYRMARPPVDSDRDGMPDAWERQHSLDPADPADASADRNGDGYTNLEEYLNGLG